MYLKKIGTITSTLCDQLSCILLIVPFCFIQIFRISKRLNIMVLVGVLSTFFDPPSLSILFRGNHSMKSPLWCKPRE